MKQRKARLSARGALRLLATATLTAAVAGCGPGFEPFNRLNSPRVLAIKSDPVAPAPGDTTTLSAATYTPNGVPLFYDWSWCPVALAPGAPCPVAEDQLTQLVGVPVSLHLGSDPSVPFTHNIPVDRLALLCGNMSPFPPLDCTDGFPIQIRLVVCTESDPALCNDVAHAVEAVRPMRLRFRDADQANNNPTITGLHALLDGMDPADLVNAMPPPALIRKKEVVIAADINPDADAEMFMGRDDQDNPALVSERLTLTWFVESGDTNHLRTSYIRGTTATGTASDRIKWQPAYRKDEKDSLRDDKDLSRVIVIIRDNRDGVGWIEGSARLVEETAP